MADEINPCLDVTLLVDEQVLWLEISVDEIQRVKVLKGQYNLGCVKAGMWFTTKQIEHNVKQSNRGACKYIGTKFKSTYLNLPILLKCENISPPGTYSIIIYRLLLSYRERKQSYIDMYGKHTHELGRTRSNKDKLLNAYLKRVLQSHQKGKVDGLQDTFLVQCVFYLLQLHHLVIGLGQHKNAFKYRCCHHHKIFNPKLI